MGEFIQSDALKTAEVCPESTMYLRNSGGKLSSEKDIKFQKATEIKTTIDGAIGEGQIAFNDPLKTVIKFSDVAKSSTLFLLQNTYEFTVTPPAYQTCTY